MSVTGGWWPRAVVFPSKSAITSKTPFEKPGRSNGGIELVRFAGRKRQRNVSACRLAGVLKGPDPDTRSRC